MREGHYAMAVQWSNTPKDVPVNGVSMWRLGEEEQALCLEGWDSGMWLSGALKYPPEAKF